jgi:hypothetical protein
MREFRRFQFRVTQPMKPGMLFPSASQETFGTPHISRNDRGAARVQPPGWKNHPGGL